MVAASKAELVSGTLRTSPYQYEDGAFLPWQKTFAAGVWTGTEPDGTRSTAGTCAGWTSIGPDGRIGRGGITSGEWTSETTRACGLFNAPIYCIQP